MSVVLGVFGFAVLFLEMCTICVLKIVFVSGLAGRCLLQLSIPCYSRRKQLDDVYWIGRRYAKPRRPEYRDWYLVPGTILNEKDPSARSNTTFAL